MRSDENDGPVGDGHLVRGRDMDKKTEHHVYKTRNLTTFLP